MLRDADRLLVRTVRADPHRIIMGATTLLDGVAGSVQYWLMAPMRRSSVGRLKIRVAAVRFCPWPSVAQAGSEGGVPSSCLIEDQNPLLSFQGCDPATERPAE